MAVLSEGRRAEPCARARVSSLKTADCMRMCRTRTAYAVASIEEASFCARYLGGLALAARRDSVYA